MEKARKTIYVFLSAIAILVAVGSLLSMLTDTEIRYLKMLDFPRQQFFLISLISLFLFVILTKRWQWYDYLLVVALVIGIMVQSRYLIHYTTLVKKVVPTAIANRFTSDDKVSILLANVQMSNRQAKRLLELIDLKDPDIVLGMEVDSWWDTQLKPIERDYPYTKKVINDSAYGMSLYSKVPLNETIVNYFQNEHVPSFESTISLVSNKKFKLYTVHPVPPTHYDKLPDNAGEEEVAMIKVGQKAENEKLPTVIVGDINDVVWSNTDQLTGTDHLLYDVRVGRGFYNSFHAGNVLMRWPLDHVFVSEEFQLAALERLPGFGSDHFPIYVELVLL